MAVKLTKLENSENRIIYLPTTTEVDRRITKRIADATQNVVAPLSHASTDTKYGVATDELYGHLRITNNLDNVSDDTAISPKSVKDGLQELSNKLTQALSDKSYLGAFWFAKSDSTTDITKTALSPKKLAQSLGIQNTELSLVDLTTNDVYIADSSDSSWGLLENLDPLNGSVVGITAFFLDIPQNLEDNMLGGEAVWSEQKQSWDIYPDETKQIDNSTLVLTSTGLIKIADFLVEDASIDEEDFMRPYERGYFEWITAFYRKIRGLHSKKVDKSYEDFVVYATGQDGAQQVVSYTKDADSNTIAQRGQGGTLEVGEPTQDQHAATKKYTDDTFVTKKIPQGKDSAYIVTSQGEDKLLEISSEGLPNTLVARDASATFEVATYDEATMTNKSVVNYEALNIYANDNLVFQHLNQELSKVVYSINPGTREIVFTLISENGEIGMDNSLPTYSQGRLKTSDPAEDTDCVNMGYLDTNYAPREDTPLLSDMVIIDLGGAPEWDYTINNNECTLSLYTNTEALEIIIPSTYDGVPVTRIGEAALQDSRAIKIDIPQTVTDIVTASHSGSEHEGRLSAFAGCTNLQSIVLHKDLALSVVEGDLFPDSQGIKLSANTIINKSGNLTTVDILDYTGQYHLTYSYSDNEEDYWVGPY